MAESGEAPEIAADARRLEQALANIVDNALRHGAGDVKIVTREERGYSALEVLDRGPGIPEGEIERLKQPFTRLEKARSGLSGSGLGLAIVDRIVSAHNGRFELLPRPGGGLTARIVLPPAA